MVEFVRRISRFSAAFSQALMALTAAALTVSTMSADADTLFEGYAKILLAGKHVGFIVQRYEFDSKKKEFKATYYLRTTAAGGNITESLSAKSNAKLNPISYSFTELVNDHAKLIDASFKGDSMTIVKKEGGGSTTTTKKIPKGSFLSSFLVYLMLQGKEGIKPGVKYSYQAIAEEDAAVYSGEAAVASQETTKGIETFKVLNTFKGAKFISFVTHKGEILSTLSPAQDISTEVVASIDEATSAPGLSVNTSNIALLFGALPKGTDNAISRGITKPTSAANSAAGAPPTAVSPTTALAPPSSPVSKPAKPGTPAKPPQPKAPPPSDS